MSLPNYLAKIKSSGIYRFVWDKSVVPPQQAETMRLVVGYSDRGPFNTPVYIESVSDFKEIFGNGSKRLERKGVFFHRLAQQALAAGPILALNLKPFDEETVKYVTFDGNTTFAEGDVKVSTIYDTNRFWNLDADLIPEKIENGQYITIASTDVKDNSCSIFIRKHIPESYSGITLRNWYASQSLESPDYLDSVLDDHLDDYFAEVYVFRGEFTSDLCDKDGALSPFFDVTDGVITLKADYKDAFGEVADPLADLANDPNSNFVGSYIGTTIPYFKDANGYYISLDLKFNSDYNKHKMLMKLDESYFDNPDMDLTTSNFLKLTSTSISPLYKVGDDMFNVGADSGMLVGGKATATDNGMFDKSSSPLYLPGYVYSTITKNTTAKELYASVMGQLSTKGIRTALTNRVDVEYHYLVDTFSTAPSFGYKKELIAIAKEKDNAFAILNAPKMTDIVKDQNCFNNITNSFDIKLIKNVLTLPSEVEGASYGAYYTQLVFSENSVKTVVPSAALVSNLFMEKWGARQPYYIVAGPTYGVINYSGVVGPDYNFGRSDLDVLEPMGINAIIYVPRKGTYINSNQTAKQVPVSGLSKVHIRELVIYLQNEIEFLLQTYQWELNTQPLRDVIKAKADAICETIKNNGGIYEFVNICDETNNTPELIDNEMIILDTEIEPARGAGKMVHQLTIHKTGGLTSSVK